MSMAVTVLAACGEDEAPPPPPSRRAAAAAAAAQPGRGAPGAAAGALPTYAKIEGRPDLKKGEAATLRHAFVPADFEPDVNGVSNRDPFRSYVVVQVSTNTEARPTEELGRAEKCANKKLAAPDTSIQQLRLIGVISRGTMRVATFVDSADVGWVVRLGDCIGSEHAKVAKIGEAFVTVENVAPATPADPTPTATGKNYKLHDTELIDQMTNQADPDGPRIRRGPRTPDLAPPPEPGSGPSGAQ
ncbi:MAG: hypothetical protein IPL61_36095 [Myxococcales bacterium]|nr:hypothetical protein [Myxococcales bacterium]